MVKIWARGPKNTKHNQGTADQKDKGTSSDFQHIGSKRNMPAIPEHERDAATEKTYWLEYKKYIAEIVTLVVLGIYTAIAAWQLCVMREATNAAHEAFVTGERPWLGVDGIPTMRQESGRWFIDYKVKNFGLSPALHSVFSSGAESATSKEAISNSIERFCATGEELTTSEGDPVGPPSEAHGYALFPGNPAPQSLGVESKSTNLVYLLGCTTYLDQFGKRPVHHTRFCYYARLPFTAGESLTPCFAGWNAD